MRSTVCPLGTYRRLPSSPAASRAATGEYGLDEPASQGVFAADLAPLDAGGVELDADSCIGRGCTGGVEDDEPPNQGFAANGGPVGADGDESDADSCIRRGCGRGVDDDEHAACG